MSTIEVKNLSKWYGQVIGVNNISLTIGNGVTGLLGPNGAGKSTLLKILTGQLKPSKGEALLKGEKVWNNYRLNRTIGYCPEQDSFYDDITGMDFVTVLLMLNGLKNDEASRMALKAIEFVEMTDAKDKVIGAYSKGMRQRVKLAQALAHDPEILFLDEPLGGMDPLVRRKTIKLIKTLGEMGKTVVVSSHILHEVEAMTDTILLMNQGKILAEGNIYQIRELIDTHPLMVYINSDNPHLLSSKLIEFEDVLSVKFERGKGGVTIETNKPDDFYLRLPQIALENNIQINKIISPDESLQAVFEYLVK